MKNNSHLQHKLILTLVFLFYTLFSISQTSQTYSTAGTYTFTVPAGVTSLTIELWGAGGGGSSFSGAAAGGGGGAYTKAVLTGLTGGSTMSVTVGAGGTVGSPTIVPGNFSRIVSGSNIVDANGGLSTNSRIGGAGGTAQTVTGVITVAWAGGAGGIGRVNFSGGNNEAGGGGGGSALTTANGGAGAPGVGSTTVPALGGTGAGAGGQGACADGSPDATAGISPGGGGGGRGEGGGTSKAGAAGQVIVTWTCPNYNVLTAAATATGPFCGTSTSLVTLRSSSLASGTYAVTYNLNGATVATGNTATMTFTAGSPGTGTFTTPSLNIGTTNITVSNLSSGSGCLTTISSNNTASVTVNPNLPASVAISATATTICSGTSVTFTAVPTNGGSTPSYQWKLNGTNVGTNSTTYTNSALANGNTITCVLTSNATPCLTGSPATSNTVSMTVNSNLPASVAISATATTICSGTSVTFTAVPTNGGTTPSYQWKLNGANVGTNSTTYTNSALANGDLVSCVLTSNATPCLTGSPATSNTVSMTVNPNLPASVAISATATTICSGTSVTFTAVPTNGGTTPSYQWKLNGTNVGTNSTTYTNSALANGNTITCVLTSNATPCLTGSPATSNTVSMTVNSNLPASVAISATATTICSGTSVTFTAVPTNGGTTPSYQWKLNGANVGTDSTTYTNSALANGDLVTCVLTSNATPCLTGSPATSNTISMTVNPNLPASVAISATATTICSGSSVTFTAVPTNGGTTPSYQWKLNGANVGTNSTTYTNSALANGDVVSCVLTSNATPCLTGSPATSNTVSMTVNPNLPASVIISASLTTICPGLNVTFTATPTNGGTTPVYQWKLNGANVGTNSTTYANNALVNGDSVTCVLTSNATPCLTGSPATSNSLTITVTDTIDPTITAPANVITTVNSGCTATSVSLGTPTIGDNCTITTATNNHPSTTYPLGNTTVIWTVTDGGGNTATANQTVTVTDTINPTITAPADVITNTNSGCTATGVSIGTPTTADNCSVASVTNDHPSTTYPLGTTTVIWTVTDTDGNTATTNQTVSVNDATNPTLTAGANQTSNTDTGICSASVIIADATFGDNCSGATITHTLSGATTRVLTTGQVGTYTFNRGVTTINYTVTDADSNTTSGSKTITVNDTSAPSLTTGANQTASTDTGVCSASVIVSDATFGDNCSGSTIAYTLSGATTKTLTSGQGGTFTFNKGVTTINYTVTDAASNTTTGSKTITVNDTSAPSLTAGTNQTASTDAGVCTASVIVADATFGDNCSGSTIAYTLSGATTRVITTGQVGTFTFNQGITTINYTVTDGDSNTTSESKTITVNDITDPTLTSGVNQLANTDIGVCTSSVVVTNAVFADNCTVNIDYTLSGATTKALTAGQVGTYTFNKGVTTINYTVTDSSNNTISGSKTITVIDNINPTVTAGANQTASTDTGVCTASIIVADATFGDNCPGATIMYTLSGATIKALTTGQVGTFTFNKGVTTINYTVTDTASNTTTGFKTITINDTTAPSLTPGANQTAGTDVGVCNASVIVSDATFNDNCSGSTISYTLSGATTKTLTAGQVGTFTFNKGVTTVNYTVTDAATNSTSSSKTITVNDTTAPTLTAGVNETANTDTGVCTASVIVADATFGDNCPGATIAFTLSGATTKTLTAGQVGTFTFNQGITTINYTVTDSSNNAISGYKTITINDITVPTLTVGGNQSANTNIGVCTSSVVVTNAVFADNCTVNIAYTLSGATTKTLTAGQVGTFTLNKGVTTINYTVTDSSNNTISGSKTITVIDNINPTITAGANQISSTDTGVCTASIIVADATFGDNCPSATIAYTLSGATTKTLTAGQAGIFTFNKGVTTINYTVTDAASNTTNGSKTITVNDTIAPTLTAGTNQAANTDTGVCTASVIVTNAVFGDNCSGATLTYTLNGATTKSLTSGQVGTFTFNRGITTINYTVTDSSNITTTGSKTITVSDNTVPTLTAGVNQAVNTGAGVCTASVAVTNATFGDNCSGPTISYTLSGATTRVLTSGQVGTYTFNLGITNINYTVTDSSNNITIGSKTITVTDVTLPTLTVGSNQNANTDSGVCTGSIAVTNATFGDNCSVTISYTLSGATVKALTLGQVGIHTFNKGVTTINYTVTDSSNNSVSDFKTITVVDAELPTITSLPTITQDCSVTIAVAPTSPDNCGTVTGITSDITLPFTYDIPGFYIIGWNFTDAAGNSKNISQTIIVTDIDAPVPAVTNLPTLNFTGCQLLSSQLTYPTAIDNCNGSSIGIPNIVFPYSVIGTSYITWTYSDDTGNLSYQEQTVIMTPENIVGGTVKGYVTSAGIGAAATVISITACASGGNVVKMDLTGKTGTVIQWEKYEAGDKIWVTIPNTTSTYTVTFLPSSTESTYFRALINVGTCYQYSSSFYVRALPADQPPVLDQNLYNICLNQQVTLVARRGYTINEDAIAGQGGDFNQGQLNTQDPDSWLVDGNPGGFTAGANNTKPRNWSGTNNQQFGAITYDSQEFKFTMSCGNHTITTGANRYTGANPTTLESPIFSLTGLSAASVDFDQAYYFATGDTAIIYISINGGATYSVLKSLHTPGQPILQWFTDPTVTAAQKVGATATVYNFKNDNTSIPLTAYLGNSDVRIKWTFRGTNANSAWAMDGITIPVKPKLDTIEWTDGIGNPGVPPISLGQLESSFTYTPEAPGSHEYGATVLVDGCRSYDESGAAIAEVNVNYSYAGTNITLTPDECGANSVKLNAYDNAKTAIQNAAKGSYTIPSGCITCDDPGTNTIGTWSITGSNTCGIGTFSNINDPDATFTAEVGTYTLSWVVFGCSSSVTVRITNCDKINFDGVNDHIDFKKENYNMSGDFSIEAWIKTAVTSSSVQTIFSKRNGNVNGNGYDLRIQNDFVTFRWNGTGSMTSPNKIKPNKWHHVAVTYANSEYKLYIDGILLDTKTGATAPITNNFKSLLGAMDQDNNAPFNPINYFNGSIDEFKIWNVALNEEQIHQMMNQEIKEQSTGNNVVYGEVLPMVINGLSWSSLRAYYRMNNISCGYLNPNFGVGLNGKLKNTTIAEEQTAPLPYYTVRNGDWNNITAASPWAYGNTVWNYPNSAGINGQFVNWNIVRTLHDINSTGQDITLLGLKVESGKITMANPSQTLNEDNNGQGLWITHYLKLDGFIDLVGKSQLLQKKYNVAQIGESILDVTSSGYIERDQKGQKNHFNYNYWSSPVSPINSTSNNTNYSVSGVMKDGTTSTPLNINWIGGLNGAPTTPISLARRWLYKFDNYSNAYANWVQISENATIRVGQGYIFKGTGTTTTNQNYTFKGKPNNGTIATNSVSSDQLLLTGNPYPSALNANKFISDNINSIDGTLYFWEHYSTNDTHILRDYQGGYATRNLTGGIAPVAPALISGRGSSSKTPNQFIPVGQSFFVNGKIGSGGTITYNNEQRGFYKENESGISNTLFKTTDSTKKLNSPIQNKIEVDSEEIDTYMRIRLGFNSNNNYHRQLLLGFMNEKATSGIDLGYDALNFDNYPNDMYFLNGENQLVIQGEGFFDVDSTYTLGVKTAVEGPVSFIIDALENFDEDQEIYIYDKLNDNYHDIRHEKFEVNLPAGTNHTRFSLRFVNSKALSNDDNALETDAIHVKHIKEENKLVINNNKLDTSVEKVIIYNLLGQNIATMKVENQDQKNIQLPIKSISAGVYIAKIKTTNGSISKKFIIN